MAWGLSPMAWGLSPFKLVNNYMQFAWLTALPIECYNTENFCGNQLKFSIRIGCDHQKRQISE